MLETIENPDGTTSWKSILLSLAGLVATVGVGTGVGYYLRGRADADKESARLFIDPLRNRYDRKSSLQASMGPLEASKQGLLRTIDLVFRDFTNLADKVPDYRIWTRFYIKSDGTREGYTDTPMPAEVSGQLDKAVQHAWGDPPPEWYRYESPPGAQIADLPERITANPKDPASFTPFSDMIDRAADTLSFSMTRLDDDQKEAIFRLWHRAHVISSLRSGIDAIDAQLVSTRGSISDLDAQIDAMLRG